MKLESQVCSLELAKRLKELGVKQESYFKWWEYPKGPPALKTPDRFDKLVDNERFAAFTVAELGEMLPPFVTTEKYLCQLKPRFNVQEYETIEQHTWHDDQEADARAKMLIHLIENGMVKP